MDSQVKLQQMLINGQWVDSADGDWINVENPSKKTVFAKVPRAGARDVAIAVDAAKQAFKSWKRATAAERGKILHQIADSLEANQENLARLISTENGNALRTQSRGEAGVTAQIFRYVAGLAREIKGKTTYLSPDNLDYTRREPYGVVGAIVPWNAPLMLSALKIAPAIMTGNTMVLKASEEAPLAVLEMARICSEFLPAGVLNVLTGYGIECGAAIAEHPGIPKVSFTGSTAVGRSILAAASSRIAAVSLELGGKSAQIILPDVDQNFTADGVITAMRFTRQSQSCTAGSRLFLHESIADSFLATLTDKLKKMRVGDPLSEETDTGSLVNAKQFSRVCSYVQEAMEAKPSSLIMGGLPPTAGPLSEGYFFEPTVFLNLPEDVRLTREEVFGPVLSISTWRDEADVIARANDSIYGLAAFVWAKAGGPALRIAHELEAGWVMVNQGGGQQLGQSYGGMKQSGAGREFSLEGMLESYTEVKQVSVNLNT
ncbi:betaine-aldehyde dehydrogenase [Jezberella montanilacus]|jgi:betaine-aldehyde dehydrogenase|uniref:Betaine-aldehyde dehydrogenase n=1 Tax=Jezberella montanilacus TaxID=323426 RepID=A0A2T0XEA6_9BURK|nr:aldehyde dehydrogenase family protein [Jezberella montanilacus]PRY97210.1 betaine-aldehyde dehydrogenase [Jezberella montanilacus]